MMSSDLRKFQSILPTLSFSFSSSSQSLNLSGNIGNDPVNLNGSMYSNAGQDQLLIQLVQVNERLHTLEKILLGVAEHFGYEAMTDGTDIVFKPTKPINYMKAKKEFDETDNSGD